MSIFISEGGARREALEAVRNGRAASFTVSSRSRINADRSRSQGFAVVLLNAAGQRIGSL